MITDLDKLIKRLTALVEAGRVKEDDLWKVFYKRSEVIGESDPPDTPYFHCNNVDYILRREKNILDKRVEIYRLVIDAVRIAKTNSGSIAFALADCKFPRQRRYSKKAKIKIRNERMKSKKLVKEKKKAKKTIVKKK